MDETGQPGDRAPEGGGNMGVSPGARRFDDEVWSSTTNDDPLEALVSSWGDPALGRPSNRMATSGVNGTSGVVGVPGVNGASSATGLSGGGIPGVTGPGVNGRAPADPFDRIDPLGRFPGLPVPVSPPAPPVARPSVPPTPPSVVPVSSVPVSAAPVSSAPAPPPPVVPSPATIPVPSQQPVAPAQPVSAQPVASAQPATGEPRPASAPVTPSQPVPPSPAGGPPAGVVPASAVPPQYPGVRPPTGHQPVYQSQGPSEPVRPVAPEAPTTEEIVVPKPATVPIPPEALLLPEDLAPQPDAGRTHRGGRRAAPPDPAVPDTPYREPAGRRRSHEDGPPRETSAGEAASAAQPSAGTAQPLPETPDAGYPARYGEAKHAQSSWYSDPSATRYVADLRSAGYRPVEPAAPASGVPASGVPASGAPASGVPASGVPASGGASAQGAAESYEPRWTTPSGGWVAWRSTGVDHPPADRPPVGRQVGERPVSAYPASAGRDTGDRPIVPRPALPEIPGSPHPAAPPALPTGPMATGPMATGPMATGPMAAGTVPAGPVPTGPAAPGAPAPAVRAAADPAGLPAGIPTGFARLPEPPSLFDREVLPASGDTGWSTQPGSSRPPERDWSASGLSRGYLPAVPEPRPPGQQPPGEPGYPHQGYPQAAGYPERPGAPASHDEWARREPPTSRYQGGSSGRRWGTVSPVGLPVRVPSHPDVPDVPGGPDQGSGYGDESLADAPDLDRIADYLSRHHEEGPEDFDRPDGFDMEAVIDAVRSVPGVREAQLRPSPDNGVHTLRLELSDDADPANVSRIVARLLKERMGLATEPNRYAMPSPGEVPRARGVSPAPSQYPREGRRRRAGRPPRYGEAPTSAVPAPVPEQQALPSAAASDGRAMEPARTEPMPLPAPRVLIGQVKVTDEGRDALVEVRLTADDRPALGVASGPAFDGYVLRLAAVAAAAAIDHLLDTAAGPLGRCFVEHAAVVSLGGCDVAVVVVLLAGDGWVDQLSGSALVAGDPRHAIVRATLAAVNRRLEALLP